ncbi:unnamed protein product [Gadus morhua 'NCC']
MEQMVFPPGASEGSGYSVLCRDWPALRSISVCGSTFRDVLPLRAEDGRGTVHCSSVDMPCRATAEK